MDKASFEKATAFPLCWLLGQKRSAVRVPGSFEGTPGKILSELYAEIDRLVLGERARNWTLRYDVVISTNARRLKSGELGAAEMQWHHDDPGVAVYFYRKDKPTCIACDRYDRIWKNLRAVQRTIEAMRAIERYGGTGLLDQAFRGFEALPAPGDVRARTWREVFGFDHVRAVTLDEIESRYRKLCKERHPDVPGGSHDAFTELNTARDQALKEIGVT